MSGPSLYRHFDGMCWPVPGDQLDTLQWASRYAFKSFEASDYMQIASVLAAYTELVHMPAKRRDALIRELRKGPDGDAEATNPSTARHT